jgi:hypothetical protein
MSRALQVSQLARPARIRLGACLQLQRTNTSYINKRTWRKAGQVSKPSAPAVKKDGAIKYSGWNRKEEQDYILAQQMAKERIAAGAKSGSKYRSPMVEIDLTLTLNYRLAYPNNSKAPHTTLPRIISPEDGGSKVPGHRA